MLKEANLLKVSWVKRVYNWEEAPIIFLCGMFPTPNETSPYPVTDDAGGAGWEFYEDG